MTKQSIANLSLSISTSKALTPELEQFILQKLPKSTITPLYQQPEHDSQSCRNELYLVTTPDQQRYVAKISSIWYSRPFSVEKVCREEVLISNLEHRGLYSGTGDLSKDGLHTLVIYKYIEGQSLKQRLQNGPVSVETTLHIVEKILDTLEYLQTPSNHPQLNAAIIHRDIKPSNVIFNEATGEVTVIDLGSATLIRTSGQRERTTRTIHIEGSAGYMAPEIFEMMPCKGSDIYSLGVMVLELLNGNFVKGLEGPLSGRPQYTIPESFEVRLDSSSTSIKIPHLLKLFLQKMIEKDTSKRFESATDARKELAVVKSYLATLKDLPADSISQGLLPAMVDSTQATSLAAIEQPPAIPALPSEQDLRPLQPVSDLRRDIFYNLQHFDKLIEQPSNEVDSSWLETKQRVGQNLSILSKLRREGLLSGGVIQAFLLSPDNNKFLSNPIQEVGLEAILEQYAGSFGTDAIAQQLSYYGSVTPQYFDSLDYIVSADYRHLIHKLTILNERARRFEDGTLISAGDSESFDRLSDSSISSLERRLFTLLLGAVTKCVIFKHLEDCLESYSNITGRRVLLPPSKQTAQEIKDSKLLLELSQIANGTFHSAHLRESGEKKYELRITIFIRPPAGPDHQLQVIRHYIARDRSALRAPKGIDTWVRSCAELERSVREICGYSIRLNDLEFATGSEPVRNQTLVLGSPCQNSERPGAWFEAFRHEQLRCEKLEEDERNAKRAWLNTCFDFQDPLSGNPLSISLGELTGILEQFGVTREQVADCPNTIRIRHDGLVQLLTTSCTEIFSASNPFWARRSSGKGSWTPWCRLAFVNGAMRILPHIDIAKDTSPRVLNLLTKAGGLIAYPIERKSKKLARLSSQAAGADALASFRLWGDPRYEMWEFEGVRISRAYLGIAGYITLYLGKDGNIRGVDDSGSLQIVVPVAAKRWVESGRPLWKIIKDPPQRGLP